MAQSALTVTAPNPTPPTNIVGGVANTGPTAGTQPPTLAFANSVYGTVTPGGDPFHPGQSPNTLAPYLDDGITLKSPNSLNENIPVTGDRRVFGAPASGTASEGAGTELSVEIPSAGAGAARGVTMYAVSTGPVLTPGTMPNPNGSHLSSLSPAAAISATSLGANNTASGGGTISQTITGTGFSPQSVIYVNGVAQTTTYTSSTSITAAAVTKKATAGTWPVQVKGPGVQSNTLTWTFT